MATQARKEIEVSILQVERANLEVCILGISPLIMNKMSNKVDHELLLPRGGRKTAADKAANLKHNPRQEFRDSMHTDSYNQQAMLKIMVTAFKGAMRTAAMDMPGASKSQIGRLIYMPGEYQPIFGIPKLFMAVTRCADIKKTPDIRTRAILPEWACRLYLEYTRPILNERGVMNLLGAAGISSGVGDWRQEKGSGSFGAFRMCPPDDKDFVRIMSTQGREAQEVAYANPEPYNDETSELLAWYDVEIVRRGLSLPAVVSGSAVGKVPKTSKQKTNGGDAQPSLS